MEYSVKLDSVVQFSRFSECMTSLDNMQKLLSEILHHLDLLRVDFDKYLYDFDSDDIIFAIDPYK